MNHQLFDDSRRPTMKRFSMLHVPEDRNTGRPSIMIHILPTTGNYIAVGQSSGYFGKAFGQYEKLTAYHAYLDIISR
ncbi:hypothetical protein [Rossellomorea sp. RS05]